MPDLISTAKSLPIHRQRLDLNGFTVIRRANPPAQIRQIKQTLTDGLADEAIRSRGIMVAARNVLDRCPEIVELWKSPPLVDLLVATLGSACGLVRVLYFDKPPKRSWGLPWHRDQTIAVREHVAKVAPFSKPTIKEGVPHVEATRELLEQMLTLRIHLDDADADNGALRVIAGSHREQSAAEAPQVSIDVTAGDCLAMRPLISHSSSAAKAGDERHRRVLHLEFAAERELPGEYEWHDFHAID